MKLKELIIFSNIKRINYPLLYKNNLTNRLDKIGNAYAKYRGIKISGCIYLKNEHDKNKIDIIVFYCDGVYSSTIMKVLEHHQINMILNGGIKYYICRYLKYDFMKIASKRYIFDDMFDY